MAPSATVELMAKISELRNAGVDIISFSVGEPDYATPDNINLAAKQAIDNGFTRYTAVAGIVELREAICEKLLQDNGVRYSPAQISVGTGAKQSLVNAVMALVDDGDEVLLPTPCWVSYVEMIKLAGGTPVLVPCREEDGFALDMQAVRNAVTPKTKAVIINSPNNPTGAVYSRASLENLGALAVERGFHIISDEVYEKLVYDGESHCCVASLSETAQSRCLIINGMSKAYAMTGWRIGYAAGPAEIIKGMNALQGHMTSNTNSITQWAGIEALAGPQEVVKTMVAEFDRRRKYIVERLREMDGISCCTPKGAFYAMPNVASFYGKKWNGLPLKDSLGVAAFLLEEAHIAVVPGAAFEAPDNIRVSYSNSMENIRRGMDRMKAALAKLE